jgi:hypothetical protein
VASMPAIRAPDHGRPDMPVHSFSVALRESRKRNPEAAKKYLPVNSGMKRPSTMRGDFFRLGIL